MMAAVMIDKAAVMILQFMPVLACYGVRRPMQTGEYDLKIKHRLATGGTNIFILQKRMAVLFSHFHHLARNPISNLPI